MMPILPHSIPGSQEKLGDDLSASILIDRHLLLQIGKNTLVNLSPEEARALRLYLAKHARKWVTQ